ncbi:TerB family tellurite resistance protein [Shewanella insulae]|uniref:TerB family tellurite resistance protein n=1 Tax=Shewanella insulae TaxID=2681496 RepID=UPI001EFED02E|nr:TerB family tellurite resistance protein [Shewanella insulae]MCG9714956.1 TerB family tellurite resistance protein [Shewanella insulae]
MFIQKLSKSQQSIFLTLANELMSVDGDISTKEVALLDFYKSQMEGDVKPSAYEPSAICGLFENKTSKIAMLLELIGLGHADGDYDNEEQSFIRKLARMIELDDSDVQQCESWVSKQIALISEANSMMEV